METRGLDIRINGRNKKGIAAYPLTLYYLYVIFTYAKNNRTERLVGELLLFGFLWLVLTLLYMSEIKPVRELFQRFGMWFRGIFLTLSPVCFFLMVESMVSNFNTDMYRNYGIYNLVWYYVITFFIYIIFRNGGLTIIAANFIVYLMGTVNYLVYLFRGNPIIPSDLLAWRTGMSVVSNYTVSFSKGFVIATLIMYAVFVAGSKLEREKSRPRLLSRFAGYILYFIFAAFVFTLFFHTNLIETKIRVIDFFAPKYTYCAYGTAFGFVANVEAMGVEAPEGYSPEKVEALLSGEESRWDISDRKPNIIAIMSEAFSDLSMLGDYPTVPGYQPFTSTLEENTTKGTLYVSVFGGATSDTEYEFLTGNSMAVMPQNSVPYQQFITGTTDSLAATLKEQGYYNIAIHPYEPSGYKRDVVYPLLGFDEFLSKGDFVNPQLIRSYISDRESYGKIIEQYEEKGEQPLFIFNVTMQNHGGYSGERLFREEDTVRLKNLSGHSPVEQYLSLLRESDKALQGLVDYFKEEEEPTIILLFGDHQPIAYSEFHKQKEKGMQLGEVYEEKYRVPFLLWANYDITEDDMEQLGANYLSSYLLKTAGLQGTAYNNYLMGLYEELPVINAHFYKTREGTIHPLSAATEYSGLIRDYRYIGYNNALDKDGKLWQYYRLSE